MFPSTTFVCNHTESFQLKYVQYAYDNSTTSLKQIPFSWFSGIEESQLAMERHFEKELTMYENLVCLAM